MLNKQKGNMYPFVTHTWNPISGKCLHDCSYCYMKVFPQKKLHLNEKTLADKLGNGKVIFVGTSTDMFAENVRGDWIEKVLNKCKSFQNNYLFQTKSPKDFKYFSFPTTSMLAVTIETNKEYGEEISKAPSISHRINDLLKREWDYPCMISIEPIMDFDINEFIAILKDIKPFRISIGADSKNHKLQEPSPIKLVNFIEELHNITEDIVLKDNLKRLLLTNPTIQGEGG